MLYAVFLFFMFFSVFLFFSSFEKMPMFLNSCIRWWKWCSMFSILCACRRIFVMLPVADLSKIYLNTDNVYKHQISSRFTMPMSFVFSYTTIYRWTFLWNINRFFFFPLVFNALGTFFPRSAFFFIFIFVCSLPLDSPPAKKCNSKKGVLWMGLNKFRDRCFSTLHITKEKNITRWIAT